MRSKLLITVGCLLSLMNLSGCIVDEGKKSVPKNNSADLNDFKKEVSKDSSRQENRIKDVESHKVSFTDIPDDCHAHEKISFIDGAFSCVPDYDSNTVYRAGSGLRLDGEVFSFSEETSSELITQKERLVSLELGKISFEDLPENCDISTKLVYSNGSFTCEEDIDTDFDTDTTYNAGEGLALEGTTFSVNEVPFSKISSGSCVEGQVLSVDSNGDWICSVFAGGVLDLRGTVVTNGTYENQDFVFGSIHLNDDPDSYEDDSRMFFDKENSAFRVGYSSAEYWDGENVGWTSAAVGGAENIASGDGAFIGGGFENQATNVDSVVVGGYMNVSGGWESIVLGGEDNHATGDFSVALGGYGNRAAAEFSMALGDKSIIHSDHSGSFLFSSLSDSTFNSQASNEFAIRATGGVRLLINDDADKGIFIDNTGYVGIGTDSPNDSLDVIGDIDATGCIQIDDSYIVGGDCFSDRNLKKNIEPLDGALERVTKLRPVVFDWDEEKSEFHNKKGREIGLIAQEVEEVFPDMVVEDENGYKRIRYGIELNIQIIQALKELREENTQLKKVLCVDKPTLAICD
ncbi:MAG: tail fiber domain-containing protein [Bacteriovoracaceae bacterium]|nr:tail fiber domain-containing protein [Bacteriovoracaceae bacterium]